MAATGLLFTLLNATMKKLAHELDPWLVGFLRYLLGTLLILVPALRFGVRELWPKAPKMQFVRGLVHGGGMLLWFAALPAVAIAELTAIGFSVPLFICLGAVLFLNERMTGARWAAVLVGFSGVLLVVHPFEAGGFSGISAGMLLMLASGPVFAGSFLVAKVLTRVDRSDVMVFWQHLVVSLALLPFALALWTMPSPGQWALLAVCGVFGAGGHYCMVRAFRIADISAVQSVRFLELVWAAILGFLMFGSAPEGWTLAGGMLILASTLWLARSESRVLASRA
ncbi:MAG: DMT family transporter [Betaproteobacteria bacterium]|nr:DMT family transporter [Betaproteobacteria bacterium]